MSYLYRQTKYLKLAARSQIVYKNVTRFPENQARVFYLLNRRHALNLKGKNSIEGQENF